MTQSQKTNPPTNTSGNLTPWKMKCLEFVDYYLACFNASEAARQMGYEGASAASQG